MFTSVACEGRKTAPLHHSIIDASVTVCTGAGCITSLLTVNVSVPAAVSVSHVTLEPQAYKNPQLHDTLSALAPSLLPNSTQPLPKNDVGTTSRTATPHLNRLPRFPSINHCHHEGLLSHLDPADFPRQPRMCCTYTCRCRRFRFRSPVPFIGSRLPWSRRLC